jgi:hypothetical protein
MMMLYVHIQQQSARFPKRYDVASDFLAVNCLAWVIDDLEPGGALLMGRRGGEWGVLPLFPFCFKKITLIHWTILASNES